MVSSSWEQQVNSATRPANIWRSSGLDESVVYNDVPDNLEEAEWNLSQAYAYAKEAVAQASGHTIVDYCKVWEALFCLWKPLESFFTQVMVNDPDPAVRANRLALMRDIDRLYLKLADFTQIVQ